MCTVRNTKRYLEKHQEQDIGISNDLPDLIPLPAIALHTGLVTSDTVHGVDTLLLGEEAGAVGCVGEEDEQDDSPDESDETEDDKEPLHMSV